MTRIGDGRRQQRPPKMPDYAQAAWAGLQAALMVEYIKAAGDDNLENYAAMQMEGARRFVAVTWGEDEKRDNRILHLAWDMRDGLLNRPLSESIERGDPNATS